MKKAIALLVALSTVLCVGLVAFADGGITIPSADSDGVGIAPNSIEWGNDPSSGNYDQYLTIGASEFFLVYADGDKKDEVVMPDDVLQPGTNYTFQIWKSGDAVSVTQQIKDPKDFITKANGSLVYKGDLKDGRLRLRTKGAGSLASASIETRGSGTNTRYNLEVNTREQYGTKLQDVEYTISVTGGDGGHGLEPSTTTVQIGWEAIDDDEIDSYGDDDIITIYNENPVITSKQFQRLSRSYNHKAIEFENEEGTWNFTARVSGNGDINFYNTEEVVEELVNKLPDQDYKFFNFHAGVKFATNGEMRLDVSDINSTFNRMYLYLYRDGRLTPVSTTYDSSNQELVFRTNYLGTFVITDEEITDLDILGTEDNNNGTEEPETPPEENDNGDNNNANTGMDASMNVLMTLGLAAISGGSIIRKKR